MRLVSPDYIEQEHSSQKRPIELHHIWQEGGQHWYYTTGDRPITYDGNVYVPAVLQRSVVRFDSTLEVSKCTVQVSAIDQPFVDFISITPIGMIWYAIMRLFLDQGPPEARVVFLGQVKGAVFQGVAGEIELVGFEFFLRSPVPKLRYQLTCNWALFESFTIGNTTLGCRLVKDDYAVEATIADMDPRKREIMSDVFGEYEDQYFCLGTIEKGNEKRTIIDHTGETITIAYAMKDLKVGDVVVVYPGCDGRPETCRDKFDNLMNAMFFPFIPEDNPAIDL